MARYVFVYSMTDNGETIREIAPNMQHISVIKRYRDTWADRLGIGLAV